MKWLFSVLLAVIIFTGCTNTAAKRDYQPDYAITPIQESGTQEEILAARRQIVADEMRAMMTVLWTPTEDVTYYITGLGPQPREVTLYAGIIYSGIPYTNGGSSQYSFLSYATDEKNGVYTLDGLTAEDMSGGGTPRIGNSCASALFWAWARVSNSISFSHTQYMTENYGCLKVGDYVFDLSNYSDVKSADVCKENGEQTMFASYAKMQMGDGMVRRTGSGGHAIMVVDTHVVYNSDGTINPNASTATIIDQSETRELNQKSSYVEGVGNVISLQTVDIKRSFSRLFESGYLPVTCKELVDPSPRAEVTVTDYTDTPTVDNMFKGVIRASYRISSVTATIMDQNNRVVQTATCYGRQVEMYEFNLFRFNQKDEQAVMQGSIDLDALPEGTYRCTFACRVSTGDNVIFRDFNFEK